jgi:dTDP-4-dehydrorhamnose 3,5-epimerase
MRVNVPRFDILSRTMTPDSLPTSRVTAAADKPRTEEPDETMARKIAGVRIERVAGYHDHRGTLFPFLDFERPFWTEPVVHGYVFTIRPGRIKGWGMHLRQADRYFVLSGNLRVVLYDGRDDSPDPGISANSSSPRRARACCASRRGSGTPARTGVNRSRDRG